MLEGPFEDIAEDLHVTVPVHGEALAGGDDVLIDYPKGAESHVGRVLVIGEAKAMPGLQPAMVEVAAIRGGAEGEGLGEGGRGFKG
jgi:hypothetical protein